MFWMVLAGLAVAAGVRFLLRLRDLTGEETPRLTDEEIRILESGGSIEFDPPTDLDEVAAEEEAFWSESWDEPDEPFH